MRKRAVTWWSGTGIAANTFPQSFADVSVAAQPLVTSGVVNRFEPPEFLELSWAAEDWPQTTQVSMILDPVAETRTLLRLEHRGWSGLPAETARLWSPDGP